MPDQWEIHNGLNPLLKDHNGKQLSVKYTGTAGYDNLECYLNSLSDNLVDKTPLYKGAPFTYPVTISSATVSPVSITAGDTPPVKFKVSVPATQTVTRVLLSLTMLSDPFAFPSAEAIDITFSATGNNAFEYNYQVQSAMRLGIYQILAAVTNDSGESGYALILFEVKSSTGSDTLAPAAPGGLIQKQ
ncbi:MAG: hypothetical protein D6719_09575 [Candidatus Dadabacteria bacterium]|nr:MAG: hypothetical protein D6719_09575 [Candidatus Dadabacteria bacterium]